MVPSYDSLGKWLTSSSQAVEAFTAQKSPLVEGIATLSQGQPGLITLTLAYQTRESGAP